DALKEIHVAKEASGSPQISEQNETRSSPETSPAKIADNGQCASCPFAAYFAQVNQSLEQIKAGLIATSSDERRYFSPAEFVKELRKRNVKRTVETIRRNCKEGGIQGKK